MAEKNKVYYGEYTLQHWIDLILTGNIILPPYQRFFVWDKEQSVGLVKALIDNQFVPPVTIGSYIEDDKKLNLILDGQQRLTSILLTYLGIFPRKENNKVSLKDVYLANENDDTDDDEIDFIDWDFNKLLSLINNKGLRYPADIQREALSAGYDKMESDISIDDYENCYLGFSFIVPATEDGKEQQKFYSKVFRSINIEGKKLLPIESRQALYYLNRDLVDLFSPDFSKNIYLNEGKMDFVRYLSMLTQYVNTGIDKIARGYTKVMESYYENFIYAVVDEDEDKGKLFGKLSNSIPNLDYKERMDSLALLVNGLGLLKTYDSIIDLDLVMFGLIYITLFEGKTIEEDKYVEVEQAIVKKANEIKGGETKTEAQRLHVKNPSALKHLRIRIQDSIDIYEGYAS